MYPRICWREFNFSALILSQLLLEPARSLKCRLWHCNWCLLALYGLWCKFTELLLDHHIKFKYWTKLHFFGFKWFLRQFFSLLFTLKFWFHLKSCFNLLLYFRLYLIRFKISRAQTFLFHLRFFWFVLYRYILINTCFYLRNFIFLFLFKFNIDFFFLCRLWTRFSHWFRQLFRLWFTVLTMFTLFALNTLRTFCSNTGLFLSKLRWSFFLFPTLLFRRRGFLFCCGTFWFAWFLLWLWSLIFHF